MPLTKSTVLSFATNSRAHYVIDATGQPVGRLASIIAAKLIGKHRVDYAPHLDRGDMVAVKNASLAIFTGEKNSQKMYHTYSGYPGGVKSIPAGRLLASKPENVIRHAVKLMLPKNRLQTARLKRLTFVA